MENSANAASDARVREFFKEVGLDESAPIDPSSLVALKDILERNNLSTESKEEPAKPPPLPQVTAGAQDYFLQRHVSDLTGPADYGGSQYPRTFDTTNAETTGSSAASGGTSASIAGSEPASNEEQKKAMEQMTPVERLMFQQIQAQTAMIRDLHRRMDQLQASMHQQNIQYPGMTAPFQFANQQVPTFVNQQQQQRNAGVPQAAAGAGQPQEVQGRPNLVIFTAITRLFESVQAIPQNVYESRYGKICRLFLALRERQVQQFDIGLIIKVLFVAAIFMSRVSRRSRMMGHQAHDSKYYIIVALIVAGFMVQTGYTKFLYNFFVKENYPGRIWEGEDLEVEAVLREEANQRVRGNNNNNNNRRNQNINDQGQPAAADGAPAAPAQGAAQDEGNGGAFNWRHTLLGGGIAPVPENDNNDAPVAAGPIMLFVRLVQDVIFLFGSFFLSIFPMWRPAPVPRQPPQINPEDPQPNGPGNNNNNEAADGQLPRVQPPVDPAAEDDEQPNQ